MPDPVRWRLVVPVKDTRIAKSRLQPPAPLSRPDLARAIARDTLEAVCRALPAQQVLTVTSDQDIAAAAAALGCRVLADPGTGLNPAIEAGLDAATTPEYGLAVLLGDLPALTGQELALGLAACAEHEHAVVPDREGSGTVLLTSGPGHRPQPRFGAGSAARHAEQATVVRPDLPRLRQDVDDLAALAAAVQLGVGPHTARLLAEAATGGRFQIAPGEPH